MNGVKFLLRRTFGRWPLWVFPLILGATILILAIAEPAKCGETDYILSRLMGSATGTVLFAMLMGIFLSADLAGNRCMRCAPIAKALLTRDVPLFFTALTTLYSLAASVVYSACVIGGGEEAADAADFVIISACAVLVCTIMAIIAVHSRYGFVLLIYIYLPIVAIILLIPRSVRMNGFGLSLGAAAGIFAGAVAVTAVVGIALSTLLYRKLNFRSTATAAEMSQM